MAQLGARLNGIQKVRGSNPLSSTTGVKVVRCAMQEVAKKVIRVDLQESLLPVNPNKPRQEQWLVWVVVAAILLYSLAVGFGLMIRAAAGGGTEWAFPLMSVPCFVTAGWYVYAYLSARSSGRDAGLVLSAVGWAAVGMAFLFKRNLAQADGAGNAQSLWWSVLAMVCIIGGAVVSISGRRRSASASSLTVTQRPPREPAQSPSPQPSEEKKE